MKISNKTTYVNNNKPNDNDKPYRATSFSFPALIRTCVVTFLLLTTRVNSHEILFPDYSRTSNNHVGRWFGVMLAPGEPSYCYRGLCLSSKPHTYVCYTLHDVGSTVTVNLPDSFSKEGDPCMYKKV